VRALVRYGTYSTRAKWRALRSAWGSTLTSCLTPPTLLEMGIYRQPKARSRRAPAGFEQADSTSVVISMQRQLAIAQTTPLYQDQVGDIPTPEFMAIVSITRLRVRSWKYLVPFLFYALRSYRQARHSQGNLAASLLRDSDRTFWTRTVWATESAMKDFMLAGAHRQVMRRLLEWCNEAALVHWEQENDLEPDWHDAQRRLQSEGRPSKVNHPSPAHESFRIRPPSC